MAITVIPADWPAAAELASVVETAVVRLDLADRLVDCTLIGDAVMADDRAWFHLGESGGCWRLTLWFHPDQVLRDMPDRGAHASARDWTLGPAPRSLPPIEVDDFSAPNAQRFVYQQLQLADDVMSGRIEPGTVPPSLVEAFQEAWLVTVDGRLQRQGLPHLSPGERRAIFLRRFGPAGILTPRHWSIFNALWSGDVATQVEVLARARLLPPLDRLRRP
ncbi:hypothetical protein GF314_15300 [bacterium]|nr:hypothetical protein [bacterium]